MKKNKIPSIISLAILTLITSILWIFFSLYRVFTVKTELKISKEALLPFTPSLDQKIISEIENRVFIEQNQIPEKNTENVTDTNTNTETKTEPTETEASSSANLEEI